VEDAYQVTIEKRDNGYHMKETEAEGKKGVKKTGRKAATKTA